jgi:hypothetical protein
VELVAAMAVKRQMLTCADDGLPDATKLPTVVPEQG